MVTSHSFIDTETSHFFVQQLQLFANSGNKMLLYYF